MLLTATLTAINSLQVRTPANWVRSGQLRQHARWHVHLVWNITSGTHKTFRPTIVVHSLQGSNLSRVANLEQACHELSSMQVCTSPLHECPCEACTAAARQVQVRIWRPSSLYCHALAQHMGLVGEGAQSRNACTVQPFRDLRRLVLPSQSGKLWHSVQTWRTRFTVT